jgi:virginiamycin B lyase
VSSASRTELLARVDLDTGRVTQTPLPDGTPVAVAAGEGAVWVGLRGARLRAFPPSRVARIDPRTGAVVKVVEIPRGVQDMTAGGGAVWITNRASDTVTRLDPATGARDLVRVGRGPSGLASGGGALWVANAEESTVQRVDRAARRAEATIGVAGQPRFVAYGGGSVWVTTFATSTLVRVDPERNRQVGEPVTLGVNPTKLDVSRDQVLVVSQADGRLERVAFRR